MTLALSHTCWSEGIVTAGRKIPQRLAIFLSIWEITSKREDCLVVHISVAIFQVLIQFLKIITQLISSFIYVCLCGHLCWGMNVGIGGKPVILGAFFQNMDLKDKALVIGLGSSHFTCWVISLAQYFSFHFYSISQALRLKYEWR